MRDDSSGPIPRHVPKQTGWRTSKLRELGYSSYRDYLQSGHWKQTRERYWESDRTLKECVCGEYRQAHLHLHHMTYLRIGRERLEDLRPLCRQCHNDIHVLAQRNLVRFDLEDYDDVRRRIIYALERRRRLERDGVDPQHISERPYAADTWRRDSDRRHALVEDRAVRAKRLANLRRGA